MRLIHSDEVKIERRIPESLKELMKKNPCQLFIAGGFIRDTITGERPSDIDVYYAGDIQKAIVQFDEQYGQGYITGNAITYKGGIQLITRWQFSKPEDCAESFDFSICSACLWYETGDFDTFYTSSYCSDIFYQDLAGKRLRYLSPLRNEDAGGSILRMIKFIRRGYNIPLDSVGRILSRLMRSVEVSEVSTISGGNLTGKWLVEFDEIKLGKVLTGLLLEVDPNSILGGIDE